MLPFPFSLLYPFPLIPLLPLPSRWYVYNQCHVPAAMPYHLPQEAVRPMAGLSPEASRWKGQIKVFAFLLLLLLFLLLLLYPRLYHLLGHLQRMISKDGLISGLKRDPKVDDKGDNSTDKRARSFFPPGVCGLDGRAVKRVRTCWRHLIPRPLSIGCIKSFLCSYRQ